MRKRLCKGCGVEMPRSDTHSHCDQCKLARVYPSKKEIYEVFGDCDGCGESLRVNPEGFCRRCSRLYQ